ncbi:NAD(P)-dependent oxidoreductase, partial [Chloroflexota bacterium]
SKIVISCLPGPPEVEEVALGANGILEGAHKGDLYIDMTTSTPSCIRKIAKVAATKGVQVLDAPVTGGVRGARLATLSIMVGGSRPAFDFCEPILKKIGERIFYVGDVGAGCVAKLVNNMMGMSNTLAAMEAMVIGAKAGVDPQKLLEVANAGTGASFMLNNTFTYIVLKGKFEPTRFAMSLAAKDFHLAVDYAHEIGVPVRVVQSVADAFDEALKQGLGEKDMTTYITLLEKAAGVEVRA